MSDNQAGNQGGGNRFGGGPGGFRPGGRLGIVGIIVVALIALYFGVDPRAAIALFNGSPAPTQQTAPAQPQAPAPQAPANPPASGQ